MTPDDVRAAAERLVDFHERFAPLFGKEQAQDHAYDYVKGLMICPDRKSIEPIALLVGHGDVSGLQKFINSAPWQYDDVQAEVQAALRRRAGPLGGGLAHRRRRRHRRVGLRQAGRALRRRGPAAQRPARQGGQLPGRRLPGRRHPRGGGAAGPPALPAQALVRGHARGPGAAREGPHPRGRRPSSPRRGSPPSWSAASPCSGRRTWTGSSPTRSTARRGTSTTRWTSWGSGTSSRCRSRPPSGPRTRPGACRRTAGGVSRRSGRRGRA